QNQSGWIKLARSLGLVSDQNDVPPPGPLDARFDPQHVAAAVCVCRSEAALPQVPPHRVFSVDVIRSLLAVKKRFFSSPLPGMACCVPVLILAGLSLAHSAYHCRPAP